MEFKVFLLPGANLTVNVTEADEPGDKSSAPVPDEIQLAPLGEFADKDGNRFTVTPEAVAAMIAGFATLVNDVPVDYEHQTLAGGKAPAAGWITELADKGTAGLWGKVKWTAEAAKHLAMREYRYLSPVLLANKKDGAGRYVPSRLHSAALTNTPQIDGMVPIVNKGSLNPLQEDFMLEKLKKLLGLPDSATEEQVEEAVIAMKAASVLSPEALAALGLKAGADASEITATVLAMKQTATASGSSAEKIAALETRLSQREAEEAVTLAMKEGKITEAQKTWALDYAGKDLPGFRMFVAKAAAVVPMGVHPAAVGGARPPAVMTEETIAIAMKMGISPERIEKQGGIE
jgi:phage I-like protein